MVPSHLMDQSIYVIYPFSRLISIILLVNKVSAGLAMGGIPVMEAETAFPTDYLLF